jgi:hypothetical protein
LAIVSPADEHLDDASAWPHSHRQALRVTGTGLARQAAQLLGHSFVPFGAVCLLAGTIFWGPWISLLLAASWFFAVLLWIA